MLATSTKIYTQTDMDLILIIVAKTWHVTFIPKFTIIQHCMQRAAYILASVYKKSL